MRDNLSFNLNCYHCGHPLTFSNDSPFSGEQQKPKTSVDLSDAYTIRLKVSVLPCPRCYGQATEPHKLILAALDSVVSQIEKLKEKPAARKLTDWEIISSGEDVDINTPGTEDPKVVPETKITIAELAKYFPGTKLCSDGRLFLGPLLDPPPFIVTEALETLGFDPTSFGRLLASKAGAPMPSMILPKLHP